MSIIARSTQLPNKGFERMAPKEEDPFRVLGDRVYKITDYGGPVGKKWVDQGIGGDTSKYRELANELLKSKKQLAAEAPLTAKAERRSAEADAMLKELGLSDSAYLSQFKNAKEKQEIKEFLESAPSRKQKQDLDLQELGAKVKEFLESEPSRKKKQELDLQELGANISSKTTETDVIKRLAADKLRKSILNDYMQSGLTPVEDVNFESQRIDNKLSTEDLHDKLWDKDPMRYFRSPWF